MELLLTPSKSSRKAILVAAYDLSIFYINIPHNKLNNGTGKQIIFCFEGGKKQFIPATSFCLARADDKMMLRCLKKLP